MEVAVVFIPRDSDETWRVSSEKIPHMTFLYLEVSTESELSEIIGYVEHVVKTNLYPFILNVKNRGLLGVDDADVLYFDQDAWHLKDLQDARAFLLGNATIKRCYEAAPQFPSWTPHLTLGYPEAPAQKTEDRWGLSYVDFDRVAVWYKDFDGITFPLTFGTRYDLFSSEEISMSDQVSMFLEHHGVKGMKWGVRHDKGHEGQSAKTKQIAKLDKKYEKSFHGVAGWVKMQNAMADHVNSRIGTLNDKYKDVDVSIEGSKQQKAYLKDYEKIVETAAQQASADFGSNASGTRRIKLTKVGSGYETHWESSWEDIKHEDALPIFRVTPKFDKKGFIVDQTFEEISSDMAQSEPLGVFLEHFGIKGMKWGVRRDTTPDGVVTAVQAKAGGKVTTEGGRGFGASDDAFKARKARAVAKQSGTDALSNKDLQELVTRMNLEQQYSRLKSAETPDYFKTGKKVVDTTLGYADSYTKVYKFVNSKGGQALGSAIAKPARDRAEAKVRRVAAKKVASAILEPTVPGATLKF